MDKKLEIGSPDLRDARLIARLAAAYTLLELAPYTRGLEWSPGDMAVYVYAQAKKQGNLGRLWDTMDIAYVPGKAWH